ncbi:hypothetical protein ACRRTK_014988 [Alexandromys fortis]
MTKALGSESDSTEPPKGHQPPVTCGLASKNKSLSWQSNPDCQMKREEKRYRPSVTEKQLLLLAVDEASNISLASLYTVTHPKSPPASSFCRQGNKHRWLPKIMRPAAPDKGPNVSKTVTESRAAYLRAPWKRE